MPAKLSSRRFVFDPPTTTGHPRRVPACEEHAMTLRPAAAALFVLATLPVCAGLAVGAVHLGDRLLGDAIPHECGKRGLVVALMGMWGTVLFGVLVGQVDWVAGRIAGFGRPDRAARCEAGPTGSVAGGRSSSG
jgi:hypothetical protein